LLFFDAVSIIVDAMSRFQGQVAVVTGGASGIGAATVRRLAAEGAAVAVADVDGDRAKQVADEVHGCAVLIDVTDLDSVRDGLDAVERELGPIDVLVNNAGGDTSAYFVDTSPAEWDHWLAVNLRGTMACTHALLPGMQDRRRGVIVNVSSEAGRTGLVAGATYSAAKAGVLGFTKAIAREAARYGVRCNAVAPGPVDTPMLDQLARTELGARIRDVMVAGTMLGRCGTAEEVAAAVAFLASNDASFITGHTLSVSGGGYVG
jgi:2-hydroxycyclohexanecarboxyl-CoA dehydrogenase